MAVAAADKINEKKEAELKEKEKREKEFKKEMDALFTEDDT